MSFGASSTSDLSHNVSMAALSSGASSSSGQWKYDVFLSFSGEDTRTNFTDHLFNALVREGIQTFKDNEGLKRGEDISSGLMAAIEDSRIAIIIFSEKYASSTWCLDELVRILDCKRDGRTEEVLPVFYRIDPSNVRKQRKSYSKAFRTHEKRFKKEKEKERVKRWRDALTEAANLSGWDQRKVADGHEAELIKRIVTQVLAITNHPGCLHVATCPTGLHSHVDAICSLLNEGGSDVFRAIGIYGPGGIGKTTIAKAVFNVMSRTFDGSCFLADVREAFSQQQGSLHLQKQLLSDILKRESIEIYNEHRGTMMLRDHLCRKRILIVLDDVIKMIHMDKLVGCFDRICPGSRIILTTRDEHLLTELDMDEKYKYKVEAMNRNESLLLFCRHAFKQDHPSEGYEQLSEKVVRHAGGLPLALEIFGLSLYQRSPAEWKYQLEKLKMIPDGDVLKKLKISYDLLDEFDQRIFLDISCFFVLEDKDQLTMILDAYYPSVATAIKILKERSLVTIDEFNCLRMHDLIRDMGREIVRNESIKNPGERSRVWNTDEAIDILRNLTGTSNVEALNISFSAHEDFHEVIRGFSRMPNLRFLLAICWPIDGRKTTINWEVSDQEEVFLFKNLVLLVWNYFPLEYIPANFHLGNLVILRLQLSNLIKVWKGTKDLKMLKVLDVRYSFKLTHMSDFSGLWNLERLLLSGCHNLVEVHESIHCLKKLVELNLYGCTNLTNLPRCINELESLEELNLNWCHMLGNLPKGFGKLKCLRILSLSGCDFTDDDMARGGLGELHLLESLNDLDLDNNKFKSLPMLPSSLQCLSVTSCYSLERLPHLLNLKQLRRLALTKCRNVTEIQGLEGLKSATSIELQDCQKLESSMKKRIFQDICKEFGDGETCDIFFPGNEVSDWFGFQFHNMEMQPQQKGLIICSTFEPPHTLASSTGQFHVEVFNNSKNFTWKHDKEVRIPYRKEFIWMIKIPNSAWKSIAAQIEDWDTVTVLTYFNAGDERYDSDKTSLIFSAHNTTVRIQKLALSRL